MWTSSKTVIPLLFLLLYWLVFNYLVVYTPVNLFNVTDVEAVDEAKFVASTVTTPQALVLKNWQSISLPDDWYQSQHKVEQIWYRSQLTLDIKLADIWAVYLPSVTHNAAVFINGTWVGQGGRFTDPVSRHHNEPLLFRFSSELLKPGANQVEIRVKTAFHEQGLLDQFYLAPVNKLEAAYEWKYLFRVSFVQWVTLAMYLMGLIVFIFWLSRPQDSIYGIFAIELFFWATHNLNLFISEIPVSARVWEAMNMSTLGWTVIAMIIFNHRYVGGGNKKIEKFMLPFAVIGIGIFFLPDLGSVLHIGYKIWDSFVMIFGIYAIFYLVKTYKQTKNIDAYLMMLVGIPILVFGFHDILLINNFIDRCDGMTMHYSVIPSIILFSWFLIRRFVQSINKAEQLTETLEQRVFEKEQALITQYEHVNTLKNKQILSDERERIMRDMHDGIGGQLVSVITVLRDYNEPVFTKIREKVQLSLMDLRLVIDSLDPLLSDLPTLLGMMRLRLVDQLESANIKLEWAVTELPEIKNMGPRQNLHIMRIVQEAITNSIKHSGTEKMRLSTGMIKSGASREEGGKIFIDIMDYGKGIDKTAADAEYQGRGLANMRYRAQQLAATLDIKSSAEGTCIRLVLNQ